MPWIGGAIAAGGSLLGGMFGSSSAKSAAKSQARAMQAAVNEQKRQFDITRKDQAPWMDAGGAAVNRLSFLLGLSDPRGQTIKDITDQLLQSGKFGSPSQDITEEGEFYKTDYVGDDSERGFTKQKLYRYSDGTIGTTPTRTKTTQGQVNWDALNAEAKRLWDEQATDPSFGSLTRNFTMADFEADPVAQLGFEYGLNQGTSAINKRAAAMGGYDSGATLKALTRFGNDYGNTKANESYNRFVNNQTNLFNRLSGLSGTGQQSANFVGAAGANMASNVGNLYAGMGNARGAASIAQGNAWSNALGGVANALGNAWTQYQQPQNQGFYPGIYNGPVVYGTSYGE